MHHPADRIAHTTAFGTPVVEHWLERKIAQWVHPMKDRSDDHEQTLLPRSYISIPPKKRKKERKYWWDRQEASEKNTAGASASASVRHNQVKDQLMVTEPRVTYYNTLTETYLTKVSMPHNHKCVEQ